MIKNSLCAFFWTLSLPFLTAQTHTAISWKERINIAKNMQAQGKPAEAALQLELAGREKSDHPELLFEAGILYAESRDYLKSAETFRTIKNDSARFPDLRLRFANALKQNEQYEEAIREYLSYLKNYTGKDCDLATEKIQDEIAGASFALRQSGRPADSVVLERLDGQINTADNQFAPIPFGDDLLYFSATTESKTRLYRSQSVNGAWTAPEIPQSIVLPPLVEYCNGAFSPDLTRFYFTGRLTEATKGEKKVSWRLYVVKRQSTGWTTPLPLRDYINLAGAKTTQPSLFYKGNKEVLFFSSDRPGGFGGMDIWYSARDLGGGDLDFETPKNAGAIVNTPGDEITPFYDADEETLYFSSNGRPTMGGMDIFKTNGYGTHWTPPENLGLPYNSGADDSYFIKNKNRTGGNLVSNRRFGKDKSSSRDDDIFAFFAVAPQKSLAQGVVFDADHTTQLIDVFVSLYEIKGKDSLRLLSALRSSDGAYRFALLPGKKYRVEGEKDGYQTGVLEFVSSDRMKREPLALFLGKNALEVSNRSEVANKEAPMHRQETASLVLVHNKSVSPAVAKKNKTEAGTVYKIQLVAYKIIDSDYRRKLQLIEGLGRLVEEDVEGKDLKRALLGDFFDLENARETLKRIREISFKDAFLVKYENDVRVR